jgi:multiple sugar transport system permease protein
VTQARAVVGRVLTYVVVALSTALFALPLLWLLSAPLDATPTFAVRLPSPITLGNFGQIGRDPYALWSLGNSLLLAIGTMAVVVAAAALAAYAISRVRIPGRNGLLYVLLLLSSVISGTAAMVPIFLLVSELHLVDSRGAVVLVLSGGLLPAAIFLLKDFIDTIPRSYEESALVFGASPGQILRHIVAPVAGPGLATVAVWTVANVWGNFLVPFLLLRSPDKAPAAVIMYTLYTEGGQANLSLLSTFSLLYSLPVVLMFVFVSTRYGFRFHGGIKR